MANKIQVKRSAVAGKVPTTADIDLGEIAINTYDGKMYIKKNDGTATVIQVGAATGDVFGPASATDNALARFDGATGKLIQNSAGILDDAGNLDVTSAKADYVDFDTAAAAPAYAQGRTFWDSGNGTPSVMLSPDVTLQQGQEMLALVYNGTGSTIVNGSVVAVSGAQGQRPSVSLADADSEALSAPTLGIATQDIANGAEGFVTTFGFVRGINTSAFTAGAPIYLSQTPGQFTATRPSAPAHTVALGWVIKVNAASGEVFVNINNGWELDELHNVLISGAASGNTLIYDAVAGVWENASLTPGTGITITGGAGSITIANSGVTSVTGTAPVVSSGGATPAISLAANYGDTLNPYASKTAKYFLAAPNAAAGVPTFRAIVASDIPTLNQSTTGSAATLTTARTLWGQSFNGSANVTGAMSSVTTLAMSGQLTNTVAIGTAPMVITSTTRVANLNVATAGTADTLTTARTINGTSFNGSANITTANWGTARTLSFTGDVTGSSSVNGSANVPTAMTLANSGATAGTYMSPKITVDAKGRVTSAATAVFTSSDNFVQFTETATGWDVTKYVFPIPSWYYIESNMIGNLASTIAYPSNFTSSPTGFSGNMVIGAYANGMLWASGLSGWFSSSSWNGTMQNNYYSQYVNWSFISPSPLTVWNAAPTSGIVFSYLQYPPASGNINYNDFFGSASSGFNSSYGSSFTVSGPPLSGASRRAYVVLMIDGNAGVVSSSLAGATVVYDYNSYANKTYVFCEVTNNTSVGSILSGSTWLSWTSSPSSYYGHAWADYT